MENVGALADMGFSAIGWPGMNTGASADSLCDDSVGLLILTFVGIVSVSKSTWKPY